MVDGGGGYGSEGTGLPRVCLIIQHSCHLFSQLRGHLEPLKKEERKKIRESIIKYSV